MPAKQHKQTREIDEMMHARGRDDQRRPRPLSYVKAERHGTTPPAQARRRRERRGGAAAQQLADADTAARDLSGLLKRSCARSSPRCSRTSAPKARARRAGPRAVVPVAREKNPTELIDEEKRAREEAAARAAKIAEMELEAEREAEAEARRRRRRRRRRPAGGAAGDAAGTRPAAAAATPRRRRRRRRSRRRRRTNRPSPRCRRRPSR